MKFREKAMRFMYGRYGADAFGAALLIFGFIVSLVSTFIKNAVASGILFGFCVLAMGLVVYRMLSRKIEKRRKENDVFLKVWNPISRFFALEYHRLRYIKTFRFRKCPDCKAQLRLPYQKGKHTVRCPRCGKSFDVKF